MWTPQIQIRNTFFHFFFLFFCVSHDISERYKFQSDHISSADTKETLGKSRVCTIFSHLTLALVVDLININKEVDFKLQFSFFFCQLLTDTWLDDSSNFHPWVESNFCSFRASLHCIEFHQLNLFECAMIFYIFLHSRYGFQFSHTINFTPPRTVQSKQVWGFHCLCIFSVFYSIDDIYILFSIWKLTLWYA